MAESGYRTLATNDPFELITTAVTGERFVREHALRVDGELLPVSRVETALDLPAEAKRSPDMTG